MHDGANFERTDRRVLFGQHFAGISGAGPLVGPILAAQMGYLPSTLWIILGVIFAGACRTCWCCGSPPSAAVALWARWPLMKWVSSAV